MSDKITIKDETAAIDMGARDLWDNFTDDQRKQISLYLLLRYASSVKSNDRELQELAVLKTNEYYNKNFFDISKHPKLLWYLVCMTGNEDKKILYHEWIGNKKKTGNNKIVSVLETLNPNLKDDEIELLAAMTTESELKKHLKDLGWDDKEIKKAL